MQATSVSFNLASAALTGTKSAANGLSGQYSQFSMMLQATQASVAAADGEADVDGLARQVSARYSETLFYSLFGASQSNSGSAVGGLLGLFGAQDAGDVDYSFHNGQYKTLQRVGQDFFNDFTSLTGTLGSLFSGFDMGGGSFSMRLDGQGHVLTDQDGAAAAKAGGLFRGNSSLVSQFAVMAARGAIVDAAESEPGFQQDYNDDPPGAIKKYIDALEERLFGFRLEYGAGGFNATVDERVVASDETSA